MRTSLLLVLALAACTNETPKDRPGAPAAVAATAQHLGQPIRSDLPAVALADVVAHPDQF